MVSLKCFHFFEQRAFFLGVHFVEYLCGKGAWMAMQLFVLAALCANFM